MWCARAFRSSSSRRPRSKAARSRPPRSMDLDHIRADLRENIERHALTLDENRPDAVARRHKNGYRMPRENIDRLVDPGSFNEYWPLVVARQHQRHSMRGIAQKHARRRRGRRHVFHQRRPVRRNAFPRGVGALRLHRARRHAGAPQSLQAGPDVRTGPPLPPAAGPVRRGRRRPARRGQYRPARRHRHAHLHHLLATQRPRAADRRRQRPHLRGQHRPGGVQRRDHRHRGFDARDGRAGDDRRRRARHLHARGSRADVVPGAEWRRRYPGEGRIRRRRYGEKVSVVFPGRDRYLGRARPADACVTPCRRTGCGSTTCATSSTPSPTRDRSWRSGKNSASGSSPPSSGSRDARWA